MERVDKSQRTNFCDGVNRRFPGLKLAIDPAQERIGPHPLRRELGPGPRPLKGINDTGLKTFLKWIVEGLFRHALARPLELLGDPGVSLPPRHLEPGGLGRLIVPEVLVVNEVRLELLLIVDPIGEGFNGCALFGDHTRKNFIGNLVPLKHELEIIGHTCGPRHAKHPMHDE